MTSTRPKISQTAAQFRVLMLHGSFSQHRLFQMRSFTLESQRFSPDTATTLKQHSVKKLVHVAFLSKIDHIAHKYKNEITASLASCVFIHHYP
ncbi:hypothetical protein X975_07660, partial [Stegodyphus mimosarum]